MGLTFVLSAIARRIALLDLNIPNDLLLRMSHADVDPPSLGNRADLKDHHMSTLMTGDMNP